MIRLNKFFVAKAEASAPAPLPGVAVSAGPKDAESVDAGSVDADFASRLRRAVDRAPEPPLDNDDAEAWPPPSNPAPVAEFDMAQIPVPLPAVGFPAAPAPTAAADPVPQHVPSRPPIIATTDPGPASFDLSQVAVTPDGAGRRAGRVRTRLLGFDATPALPPDPIAATRSAIPAQASLCPVGWIVITGGPGRGSFFALFNGVSQIGRGEDQAIKLDFGDTSISRSNHAVVAYDDERNGFFLGHGGKTNLVRLNDRPVISTEELRHHDIIRIGETTLMFVALCSADFRWAAADEGSGDFG